VKKHAYPDCNISAKPSCCPSLQKDKVKPMHIIDVPGHARLKPKLDEVLPKAAAVVFVVDAQDFLSSMQAAAE
jgi:signal recognition particle receptor subunit beta